MDAPSPKLPLLVGGSGSHLTHNSLGHSEPTIQMASRSVQPLSSTGDCRVSLYFTMGRCFPPSKLPLPMGHLDPHLIHGSLGLPKSSTQTASRLVQPFLQGSLVWQTDRPTDHATWSVTIGCIYVRSTAMWSHNTVKIYYLLLGNLSNTCSQAVSCRDCSPLTRNTIQQRRRYYGFCQTFSTLLTASTSHCSVYLT